MRPSDPRPPLSERPNEDVLEELCLALRDVGVHDSWGVLSDRGKAAIERVQAAVRELNARGVGLHEQVAQLSGETGWQMDALLKECQEYPRVRPRLRERDGIRRALRCRACSSRERPESDERYFLCDQCLTAVAAAIRERKAMPALLLMRTHTPEARCGHAGDDTVLAVYPWCGMHDDVGQGFCLACVDEEHRRRGAI